MTTDYISAIEAAKISGYHDNYIRRLCTKGKLRAEKKGQMWWIDRASLAAYMAQVKAQGAQRFNWRKR